MYKPPRHPPSRSLIFAPADYVAQNRGPSSQTVSPLELVSFQAPALVYALALEHDFGFEIWSVEKFGIFSAGG
jgi:hypothetical protein